MLCLSRGNPGLLALLALIASCATLAPKSASVPVERTITAQTVDTVLQPGDFLFRYVNPKDPLSDAISGGIIKGSQSAMQATSSAVTFTVDEIKAFVTRQRHDFDQALAAGDPNAVHMGVYLGQGETAEAFGTSVKDAGVRRWSLFLTDRKGTTWRVFRYKDQRVAKAVAEVARRWATGRIGYRVPFEVFVRDAEWGERGRSEAMLYAQAFRTDGGPPHVNAMFCSQFAVAAAQSAAGEALLGAPLKPEAFEALPDELKIDSVASPLRVYGRWSTSPAFTFVGHLVIE